MIVLITSGAYVNREMAAEFGMIPPSFLPLGTRRLIDCQVASVKALEGVKVDRICVSLPESFTCDQSDQTQITQAGVEILHIPDGLTLGQSILSCLARFPSDEPILVLHGDTLVADDVLAQTVGNMSENACVVAPAPGSYAWGRAFIEGDRFLGAMSEQDDLSGQDGGDRNVLVGVFAFNTVAAITDALRLSNSDFITALSRLAYPGTVRAVSCESWTDFGHLQTYYKSRAGFASARMFNDLQNTGGVVRKTGLQSDKLRAEAFWFENIPARLRPYTARLIDAGELPDARWYYETEYEYMPTLQELFLFGRLSDSGWDEILEACSSCLSDFAASPIPDGPQDALQQLTRAKTWERIERFEREAGIDMAGAARLDGKVMPSPRTIAAEMIDIVSGAGDRHVSAMHGDFCFSNILLNGRTRRIRLIDPRGTLDGSTFTCGGDIRYDMAKLAHSVIGFYDLIIAGRADCRRHGALDFDLSFDPAPGISRLGKRFVEHEVAGTRFDDPVVLATMVLLFLSMLPLHDDRPDRQEAFLANALRLYSEHFRGSAS